MKHKTKNNDPVVRIGKVFAFVCALVCIIPVFLLIAVATTRIWQQGLWAEGFTLRWLRQGWQTISPYVAYSVRLAITVLLLNFIIGFPASWILARYDFFGKKLLSLLATVPIAIPGITIALSLILAYPLFRSGGLLLTGGHVLYTLPFFIGTITPALGRKEIFELENVARTLGCSPAQRLFFITIPQIRKALLAASIIVLTLSLGEFNVSFFLITPIEKTLPVELYSSYITGRLEVAAANTVWFLIFVIPASIAIESMGGAKVGQA